MWTVSGDYSLDFKPDLAAFARSRYGALYDGMKQGAFARYFDREVFSMYLVKKMYCHAMEGPLLSVSQLCIEFAVSARMIKEREGVGEIRRKACEDILEKEQLRNISPDGSTYTVSVNTIDLESLKKAMAEAVEQEDYERASQLRDEIRKREGKGKNTNQP